MPSFARVSRTWPIAWSNPSTTAAYIGRALGENPFNVLVRSIAVLLVSSLVSSKFLYFCTRSSGASKGL